MVGAYLGAKSFLDIDTSGLDAAEIVKRAEKPVDAALAKIEHADGELCVSCGCV